MNTQMMFARAGEECCQCENVAITNTNFQLDTGNIGTGNTCTLATFNKMFARGGGECCQCGNVAKTKSNFQLGTGNIGIGNTCTMATFNKIFARVVVDKTKGAGA